MLQEVPVVIRPSTSNSGQYKLSHADKQLIAERMVQYADAPKREQFNVYLRITTTVLNGVSGRSDLRHD